MCVVRMQPHAALDASRWHIASQIVRSQTGLNINLTVPSPMLLRTTPEWEGKLNTICKRMIDKIMVIGTWLQPET